MLLYSETVCTKLRETLIADRHRAHCVSFRHRLTPPHELKPPDVVVVVVVVDVDKSMDVGLTSSPVTVVAIVSKNSSEEGLAILPKHVTMSMRSLSQNGARLRDGDGIYAHTRNQIEYEMT